MPYPFAAGDKLTPLHERFNEAVEASMQYADDRMRRVTAYYTLRENQTIPKSTPMTLGGFYLKEGVSHPDIDEFVTLNTDAGRGVWTFQTSGYYSVYAKQMYAANPTGHRYIYPRIDNVQVDTKSEPPGNSALLTIEYEFNDLWFNAGQDIRFRVQQNADPTGGLAMIGSANGYETQVFFKYEGVS